MLGGRCNAKEITHDVNGSANDECADVNPGALHVILTNFLGIAQAAARRGPHGELRGVEPAGARLRDHQAGRRSRRPPRTRASARRGSTWTYNTSAKKLYEVRMTVDVPHRVAARAARPLGCDEQHVARTTTTTSSSSTPTARSSAAATAPTAANSHVDFLWSPTGTNSPEQPERRRREGQAAHQEVGRRPSTVAAAATARRVTSRSPRARAIPDNNPTGVTVDVPVTGVTGPEAASRSRSTSRTRTAATSSSSSSRTAPR